MGGGAIIISMNSISRRAGFTIVELLIVIIVIAILATITIVAFSGIQRQARDTKRKQDVAQIAKQLQVHSFTNGPIFTGSGCGSAGNGAGWYNYLYSGYVAIDQCVVNGGTSTTKISDTMTVCNSGDLSCRAYMKYTCVQSGQTVTYVYANLEGGTHDGTEADGTCAPTTDTSFGMNYYVKIFE